MSNGTPQTGPIGGSSAMAATNPNPKFGVSLGIHKFAFDEKRQSAPGRPPPAYACRWFWCHDPRTPLGSTPAAIPPFPSAPFVDWSAPPSYLTLSANAFGSLADRVLILQVVELEGADSNSSEERVGREVSATDSATSRSSLSSNTKRGEQVVASGTIDLGMFQYKPAKDYSVRLEKSFLSVGKLLLNLCVAPLDNPVFEGKTQLERKLILCVEKLVVDDGSPTNLIPGAEYYVKIRFSSELTRRTMSAPASGRGDAVRWNYDTPLEKTKKIRFSLFRGGSGLEGQVSVETSRIHTMTLAAKAGTGAPSTTSRREFTVPMKLTASKCVVKLLLTSYFVDSVSLPCTPQTNVLQTPPPAGFRQDVPKANVHITKPEPWHPLALDPGCTPDNRSPGQKRSSILPGDVSTTRPPSEQNVDLASSSEDPPEPTSMTSSYMPLDKRQSRDRGSPVPGSALVLQRGSLDAQRPRAVEVETVGEGPPQVQATQKNSDSTKHSNVATWTQVGQQRKELLVEATRMGEERERDSNRSRSAPALEVTMPTPPQSATPPAHQFTDVYLPPALGPITGGTTVLRSSSSAPSAATDLSERQYREVSGNVEQLQAMLRDAYSMIDKQQTEIGVLRQQVSSLASVVQMSVLNELPSSANSLQRTGSRSPYSRSTQLDIAQSENRSRSPRGGSIPPAPPQQGSFSSTQRSVLPDYATGSTTGSHPPSRGSPNSAREISPPEPEARGQQQAQQLQDQGVKRYDPSAVLPSSLAVQEVGAATATVVPSSQQQHRGSGPTDLSRNSSGSSGRNPVTPCFSRSGSPQPRGIGAPGGPGRSGSTLSQQGRTPTRGESGASLGSVFLGGSGRPTSFSMSNSSWQDIRPMQARNRY